MKITVEITRVSDGETTTYAYEDRGPVGDIRFGWELGNEACDCVRGEKFAKARDEEDPEHECGFGLYRVVVIGEQGIVIYKEPAAQ